MIVVVPVDPPWRECVQRSLDLPAELSDDDATALYEAAVTDVVRTVQASAGQLLVNHRDRETLPSVDRTDDPADTAHTVVTDALSDPNEVRFERQIGSTVSARIGNTVTPLLDRE